MIKSCGDRDTEKLYNREPVRKWQSLQRVALRKLVMIDYADQIEDLRSPSGNRLEKLVGNRAGQWSIRINDQWRVCFEWEEGNAENVEITDYH